MRTLILLSLLSVSTLSNASDALLSRNLQCNKETRPRAQAICHALEHEMHWEWTGHAIISPSFRVNFDSVRETYCHLPIRADDTATLVEMVLWHRGGNRRDVQIVNGASWLLYLLGTAALDNFPKPETIIQPKPYLQNIEFLRREIIQNSNDPGMIWNCSNPHYLLRNGCQS